MKVKTNELTGRALDWAVASALPDFSYSLRAHVEYLDDVYWVMCGDGVIRHHIDDTNSCAMNRQYMTVDWSPSTDWAQAGPIIDQEKITLRVNALVPGHWAAFIDFGNSNCNIRARQSGQTPLIAACRCFVAHRLGDTVDIPEELT